MNGPWSSILRGAYTKQTKKKKIKCDICYRSFTNEGNLVNHMNTHKKFNIFIQNKGKFSFLPLK